MRRLASPPRPDWRAALSAYDYGEKAAPAAACWDESVRYEFSADQIDMIEEAADEVHGLVHDAIGHVVGERLHPLLGIKPDVARMIDASWTAYGGAGEPNDRLGGLFGRLDFAYDGRDSLKLLGCDYDGPTGLFESSIVQWNWLEAAFPDADQFNGLHEGLVGRWQALASGLRDRGSVHLTCATPDSQREGELAYLAATADEAGLTSTLIGVQDIGWDGTSFFDVDEYRIAWLLKLYPWEAMVEEEYGAHLHTSGVPVLDPLWRMPGSNHGLLAVLWDLYPEHPNLCHASLGTGEVRSPHGTIHRSLFGLDRAAERIVGSGGVVADTGAAANPGGTVAIARPPSFESDGVHAIIQTWMIGNKCLGMAVRESD
ncbi:MAG: glutathionylspermidine synthase family protein, partial [Alphaproteobacteria bacterium]|nr:glutathionylspermidine synthase family protein [Alphaproteobacteria bacterium]